MEVYDSGFEDLLVFGLEIAFPQLLSVANRECSFMGDILGVVYRNVRIAVACCAFLRHL